MATTAIRQSFRGFLPPRLQQFVSSFSYSSSSASSRHKGDHEFSRSCEFLGSWKPPKDPKEAEKKLGLLRRDYAKNVKELRKQYIYETQLLHAEKERKEEAKREAIRIASEERKAAKQAISKSRAAERRIHDEEFRQALMNERAKKLESWRTKESMRENKKREKVELLRRQSAAWIEEQQLEKRILEAVVDSTPL